MNLEHMKEKIKKIKKTVPFIKSTTVIIFITRFNSLKDDKA